MPLSFVVYSKHRLVISTGSDLVTWEEISERQNQTKTDREFNPEFNQLVDLRAVTRFDLTSDQARTLARRMIFSATSKRSLVAANPAPSMRFSFAFLRMMSVTGMFQHVLLNPAIGWV
jgi:hypothetical protein